MLIAFLILAANFCFSDVCTSLSNLACAPGKYSDGTGSVPSESEVKRARSKLTESTRDFMTSEFESLLKNPDNVFFRETAKEAFGLSEFPSCSGKTTQDILDCDQNIVEGLTNLGEKTLFDTSMRRVGDLESIAFITKNHMFDSILEKATTSAEKQLGTEPITQKIQNTIFPSVKNAIVTKISTWPLSEQQKQIMISKVKSIRFDGSDCPGMGGGNMTAMLTPNAYYSTQSNTFNYCAGMMASSSSEFTLAMIVAHELAHSIDPCNISNSLSKIMGEQEIKDSLDVLDRQSPYASLIQCLRSEESVRAENFAGQQGGYGQYPFPPSYGGGPTPPAPKKEEKPTSSLCENDQIQESFCDWVATEILSDFIHTRHKLNKDQYVNGYANAFRPLCDTYSDPKNKKEHPRSQERIDKIILANPKIRKDMGCPPEDTLAHCSFDKTTAPIKEEVKTLPVSPQGGRVGQ